MDCTWGCGAWIARVARAQGGAAAAGEMTTQASKTAARKGEFIPRSTSVFQETYACCLTTAAARGRLRRYVRRGVTAEAAAVLPLLRSEAGTENAECFLPQVMTTTTV